MTAAHHTLPLVTDPDVRAAVVGRWTADSPEHQLATADAVVAHVEAGQWPEGLQSFSSFVSTEGTAVLTYSQWTDEPARERLAACALDLPGTVATDPVVFRVYRSTGSHDTTDAPGCVFVVLFEIDGADVARRWVDTVLDSIEGAKAQDDQHPGMISAHFHISIDGTRVLNYAEWTSPDAHREFIAGETRNNALRSVDGLPSTRNIDANRYLLHLSLSRP